jgi:hypothetical protein
VTTGNIAAARTFFFDADNGYEIGSAFFAGKTVIRQAGGAWGAEWNLSYRPDEFLYGIDFRASSTGIVGIVGGHGGFVHRTFNGGATWDTVKTVVDSTINALKFVSDRTILAASDNDGGALLISHDTGRTWSIDMSTLTFAYPDIKGLAVSRRDSFIAVGHTSFGSSGIILWQDGLFANNYMTPQRLNAVAMRNDSVAYIVGDSGSIYTNRQAFLGLPGGGAGLAGFSVFPNPATGACYTEAPWQHTLRLYDPVGRLVWTQAQARLRHSIPLDGLCPGIYVIQVLPEGRASAYRKLVVE